MEGVLKRIGIHDSCTCPVISVTGAGGKTSVIRRMAEEAVSMGLHPIVTTTTHMRREEQFLVEPTKEQVRERIELRGQAWLGASCEKKEKIQGMPLTFLEMLYRERTGDLFLVEADGARMLPCKVPGEREPVIWRKTTHVLSVYGLDSVGQPLGEACFRAEQAAKLLKKKQTDLITPADIAVLGIHRLGGCKGVSEQMRHWIILNKADEGRMDVADEISRELSRSGFTDVLVTVKGKIRTES